MIKQLTDKSTLENLSCTDIYAGKIKTLYRAYGLEYKHCIFFEQGMNLLISQLDRDFVISENKNNNSFNAVPVELNEELASFLKMNRATGVFLSPTVLHQLEPFISGDYLYNNLMEYNADYEVKSGLLDCDPKLDDMFDILKHDFNIKYDLWLTDASHRKRHGISTFYLYDNSSAATVLYDSDGIVFITQVATKKQARGKGLATNMLREIAGLDIYKGKKVVLVCRDKMLSFYENVGYKKIDGAAQIYRLDY